MKTPTRLSALALLTGVAGLTLAAPAIAKDKKEDAKAPGMKLSPAVVKVAKQAQDSIAAGDLATGEPLVVQIETASATDDDRYVGAVLRYNLEVQRLNAARTANPGQPVNDLPLVKPLDALIANASTPAPDRARYYFRRGAIYYNSKQYAPAIQYLTKARDLGYADADLNLSIVKSKVESGDVAGGTAELQTMIDAMNAKGEKAPAEYYRYAIARAKSSHLKPQTISWLRKYVVAYPEPKSWYESLATYGFEADAVEKLDNQQKIDLFRLMRATGGLSDQYFYLEYAQKAQNAGLPLEAQAVLKEGLANGKIPASNTEAKALLTEIGLAVRNEGSLASLETKARAGANGTLATQTGDANLGAGNYAKAVELYRLGLQKGGVDANVVNTRLGIALARSGDKAGARTAFAAVSPGPRGDIAGFWTTYLDQAA